MLHNEKPIIEIKELKHAFGSNIILDGVNLTIYSNEIMAIVGGSGSGKSTLLNNILMLNQPFAGSIHIFGQDILKTSESQIINIKKNFGVAFQHGALFSSLTVLENVIFPMRELANLAASFSKNLALLKIKLAGLPLEAAFKYPAELSGGMQKRAALARALALDPQLLILDEPTAGLDPKSVHEFNKLIIYLRNTLNLTVLVVTHDLELLKVVPDRVAFLGEKKVLAVAPLNELAKNSHPLIKQYFWMNTSGDNVNGN